MDRITTGLLAEFVQEFNLGSLPEDRQFEHFATYVAVRRHYSETAFQTHDLVMQGKRRSGAVHSAGLKFHGISASISLFGHRLAIRSRVCLAQALGSTSFILQV